MNSKQHTSAERRRFLTKLLGLSASAGLLLSSPALFAASASKLQKITSKNKGDSTHVSFELNQPTQYKVFTLNDPERVIIDFSNTQMSAKETVKNPKAPLQKVRNAVRNGKDLRIVLDLKQAVHVSSEMRPVDGGKSYRLSVTLKHSKSKSKVIAATPLKTNASKRGTFVIAIDAGHGGKDPGAVGKNRTYEKNVVLKISRELKKLVDKQPGMKAVMTRDGDYYLPLRRRIDKAKAKQADIFLSIHADANRNRKLTGSSVYILSNNGASSEAAHLLAKQENAFDIANVSLSSHDKKIASVLLDLSQSATLEQSLDLAHDVLDQLAVVRKPFRNKVESAEFQVLKSPDIPSVLVETAFISNPAEEKKLVTSTFQKQTAKAIFTGVKKYYTNNHMIASRSTGGSYTVKSGDTLSEIAENHGVSTSVLRRHNGLRSDGLKVGQKLKIPAMTYEI